MGKDVKLNFDQRRVHFQRRAFQEEPRPDNSDPAVRKVPEGNCENAKRGRRRCGAGPRGESAKGRDQMAGSPGTPLLFLSDSRFRSFSRFRSSCRRPFRTAEPRSPNEGPGKETGEE